VALKILCAGCSKDERAWAEAAVRRAVGKRAETGAWTVSLVKVAASWSASVDAPAAGIRALTLVASGERLGAALAEAIASPAKAPAAAAASPAPAAEHGARFACGACGQAFVVVYQAVPGERERTAPAACPRCWHVNRVSIGENAAESQDYRTEKA
jgi:hypothetical protein